MLKVLFRKKVDYSGWPFLVSGENPRKGQIIETKDDIMLAGPFEKKNSKGVATRIAIIAKLNQKNQNFDISVSKWAVTPDAYDNSHVGIDDYYRAFVNPDEVIDEDVGYLFDNVKDKLSQLEEKLLADGYRTVGSSRFDQSNFRKAAEIVDHVDWKIRAKAYMFSN